MQIFNQSLNRKPFIAQQLQPQPQPQPEQYNELQNKTKLRFVGWICQIICIALIIVYVVLSPSLFSILGVFFMILALSANISGIFYLKQKNQGRLFIDANNKYIPVSGYPLQRVIWTLFTLVNISALVWKGIVLVEGISDQYSQAQQQFYEIQSPLYMFVPSVILPFSIGAIFIIPTKRRLEQFLKPVPSQLQTPSYLLLSILIVVIQIFSPSLIGMGYFFIIIGLFFQPRISFDNYVYRGLVYLIQLVLLLTIVFAILVITAEFQSFWLKQYYSMIGVQGISQFITNWKSRGHFITQIVLFLYCCFLQRMFEYDRISRKANDMIERSLDQSDIIAVVAGGIGNKGKVKERKKKQKKNDEKEESFNNSKQNLQQSKVDFSPARMLRESLLKLRRSHNEQPIQRSYQMSSRPLRQQQNMKQQKAKNTDNDPKDPKANKQRASSLIVSSQHSKSVKQYNSRPKSILSESIAKSKKQIDKQSKQLSTVQMYLNIFLNGVNQVARFLNSPGFTLRVVEIISIIVIQRYNNVYSFVVLLWLALVASVENLRVVFLATTLVILPLEIGNYVIMFLYNIPNSFFSGLSGFHIWGFEPMQQFWLDIIVFNIYLYYIVLFVMEAGHTSKKNPRASTHTKSKQIAEPTTAVKIIAFIFRYTYLLTIAAMFYQGFSNVTVFDFIYVLLFLVFFTFGENVYEQEKKRKKPNARPDDPNPYQTKKVLTTFCYRFWFVIIYYTLACIVAKYTYFLFFDGKVYYAVQPFGINEVYNWSFNFSLSSVCKSNTTSYFIVFILAEAQILVHRSSIYLNYSFSTKAATSPNPSEDRLKKQARLDPHSTRVQRIYQTFHKILIFCLQSYYQGLYFFGGAIIIGCTYRWNIIQIPIVILTCIGLLSKFSRKLLASIVLVDLFYVFTNYCFRFVNYQATVDMFGPDFTQTWKKIAMFCGFIINPDIPLQFVFAFNVVIFYFSVESYRLCGLLAKQNKNKQNSTLNSNLNSTKNGQNNDKMIDRLYPSRTKTPKISFRAGSSNIRKNTMKNDKNDDILSQHQTVIGQQYNEDQQFAIQFQNSIQQNTLLYYNTNMIRKYAWLRLFLKILTITIVDIVAIVVLVCSLYFRLSISMLLFLIVYLTFYYLLFDSIGKLLIRKKYMQKIQDQLDDYNSLQSHLQQRHNPNPVFHNPDKLSNLQKFINQVYDQIINQKYKWKNRIWIYSATLSVSCLVLTYAAQFIVSEFYTTQINLPFTDVIENVLFVGGFSVSLEHTFFRQVYFYYFMVIINVIEKLLIAFMKVDNELKSTLDVQKDLKTLKRLNDPKYFIDKHLYTEDFMEGEPCIMSDLQDADENAQCDQQTQLIPDDDDNSKQLAATANILIFFSYKQVQIHTNILYGTMSAMVRLYLWLMLINVYEKSNLSAFLFMFTVMFFWFRRIQFSIVKNINKAAILILLFQYIMLLLDIDQQTSPLSQPNPQQNLSVLELIISDEQWMDFLVISRNTQYSGVIFLSFFINSIVIFITEVYFAGIQWASWKSLQLVEHVWARYDYIYRTITSMDQHQRIDLNFDSYKSFTYRVFTFVYDSFITNSYLIVSIIILLLLSSDKTYIALGMLIFAFVYIYMSMFTDYGTDENIYKYTQFYFKIFRIVLFVLIVIQLIIDIPIVQNYVVVEKGLPEVIGLNIGISEVLLILSLQLWLDLTSSKEFYRVTVDSLKSMHKRQAVRLKCLAYQANNCLIHSLVDTYNYILTFDVNIQEAKMIIKKWDENFKVEEDLDQEEKKADEISLDDEDQKKLGAAFNIIFGGMKQKQQNKDESATGKSQQTKDKSNGDKAKKKNDQDKEKEKNQQIAPVQVEQVDDQQEEKNALMSRLFGNLLKGGNNTNNNNPNTDNSKPSNANQALPVKSSVEPSPSTITVPKSNAPANNDIQKMSDLHLQKLKQIKQRQLQKQQQLQQQITIGQRIAKILEPYINHSLSYSYFEMTQYIVKNSQNILRKSQQKGVCVDIWDYIQEDYSKLQDLTVKSSEELAQIGKRVAEEDIQYRLDLIKIIKEEEYDYEQKEHDDGWGNPDKADQKSDTTPSLYKVTTPSKLNLVVKQTSKSVQKFIWYWFLSTFNYFLSFMIWVYYILNPSLLSMPLVVYLFAYDIVADRKFNNGMLLYIFLIILLGEMFQLDIFFASPWTKYLFFLSDQGDYHFSIAFLFFLFVLIFVNEEIKKYQGIKYKHESQAENLQTSGLRVLINEPPESQMYLWKMLVEDEHDYEKGCNPILYFAEKIETDPTPLFQKSSPSFSASFYRNKVGIDLYPYIATVQILTLLYLIFLYPLMTLTDMSALEQTYKYFSFSANMVLSVLAQVFVICVQRKITLLPSENRHKELIKYVFTMIIFTLFIIFIYYWASYRAPAFYQPPAALVAFSIFYFIYFFLSGLQVKYGYEKFKKINSFMVNRSTPNYFFLLIFIAIPFMYEIKCIMDWTFLQTSIQLFDWFKLFSIYVSSFKSKMSYEGSTGSELGNPLAWSVKIMGWVGFSILLLIILGPMILFSGLNPASQSNLVVGGSLQIGIQIVGGNSFTLYSSSHLKNPPISFNESYFEQEGLNRVPLLEGLTQSSMQKQLQEVTFQTYSDEYWGISPPSYEFLKQSINQTVYQLSQNITPTYQYKITFQYYLQRQVKQATGSNTDFEYPANSNLNSSIISQLNETLHTCNKSTTLPNLYNSLIRLTTSGTTYKPNVITFSLPDGQQPYLENVNLTMVCPGGTVIDTNNIYWEILLADSQNGAEMYVFCDLYQGLLGGLSFTAIYTSIILVVAGFVRSLLAGNLTLIPYEMNPKPEKILQICEAIGTLRDRKQYRDEFIMYYQLIDVIRSPQVIRKLGASYAKQIERQYKIRKTKEKNKQLRQDKKNL